MSKLILGLCVISTTALVAGCVADTAYYETGPGYATTSYAVYSDPYPSYYSVSYDPYYSVGYSPVLYDGLGGWGLTGYYNGWHGWNGYRYAGYHHGGYYHGGFAHGGFFHGGHRH